MDLSVSHHRRRLGHFTPAVLLRAAVSGSFQPALHMLALYELNVVFIDTAGAHQHTQEVDIVAQVLQQRRPRAADGGNREIRDLCPLKQACFSTD